MKTSLECLKAKRVFELLVDYACAAKCPFCYNPPLTAEVLSRRLSLDDIAQRLYLKRSEGFDGAWFTGGEVTQREDLPKILGLAKKLGFRRIQIGTNGLRTAQAGYARRLARSGLNYARVSIHAASARVHDSILGVPGAFEKAVRSLETLREAGVAVGVNFVVCKSNLEEPPAFLRAALLEWKVDQVDILFPHYRGMMEIHADEIGVTYTQARSWLKLAFDALGGQGMAKPPAQLVNFPPCTLPAELRPWAADWRCEDFSDHSLAHPEGKISDLKQMKTAQKVQGEGCRGCALKSSCAGFEREYALHYGEAEFEPVGAA